MLLLFSKAHQFAYPVVVVLVAHSGHLADGSEESDLLHSTVVGSTVNTSEDVMDTSHLSQESVGSSGLTSSSDSAMDSGVDRAVDSSSVGQ